MLSLFFGVGISYFLRYGLSNTSMVEMVNSAHAFVSLINETNMGARLENSTKYNPALIDLIFKLMFETVWLAPHDQRRGNPEFRDFEQSARHLVGLLCATDLATASGSQLQALRRDADVLAESVERLFCDGVIARSVYVQAIEQTSKIKSGLVPIPKTDASL